MHHDGRRRRRASAAAAGWWSATPRPRGPSAQSHQATGCRSRGRRASHGPVTHGDGLTGRTALRRSSRTIAGGREQYADERGRHPAGQAVGVRGSARRRRRLRSVPTSVSVVVAGSAGVAPRSWPSASSACRRRAACRLSSPLPLLAVLGFGWRTTCCRRGRRGADPARGRAVGCGRLVGVRHRRRCSVGLVGLGGRRGVRMAGARARRRGAGLGVSTRTPPSRRPGCSATPAPSELSTSSSTGRRRRTTTGPSRRRRARCSRTGRWSGRP